MFEHDGSEAGEEGPLAHGRLRRHRPPLRLELDDGKAGDHNCGYRLPGVSVIPTLLIYFLLGYLLPEADEF